MSKFALIFDVETTGLLPKVFPANLALSGTMHLPYITQISWVKYDMTEQRVVDAFDSHIRIPNNVSIEPKAAEITGITAEFCHLHGRDIVPILLKFYDAVVSSNIIVGHNVEFDRHMVKLEVFRNWTNLKSVNADIENMFQVEWMERYRLREHCTMHSNIQRCNIKRVDYRGRLYTKYPKLTELHEHLFACVPENMHNSLFDVMACLRCFLATVSVYQIPDIKFTVMMRMTTKLAADQPMLVV